MADSVMTNIAAVEQYGKNLENIDRQMMEIFLNMQRQTENIGQYWKDDKYTQFRQDFELGILKHVQEINLKLEVFAKYVSESCNIQRMYQSKKYY